ncbi:hypothetical protein Tco_0636038 [Tanacetum coccineum]
MSSIYVVTSTLTQTDLDAFCQKYHIPDTVHPKLPGPNQNIHNSPASKIGVYNRFFDFANFQIPFSRFLVDVLKYFCYVSTVGLFRRFYINSKNKEMDLFAFIRHADPTKVRISERQIEGQVPLLDSTVGRVIALAGEDDQAGPVVQADHGDQNDSIENIGHDGSGDADQENHSEGSDRAGQDEAVTIVVDEEFQAAADDKPKSKKKKRRAVGASGSNHPPKKLREDHDTSGDAGASTGGKSLDALQGLLECSTLAAEVGVTTAATMPFVTSSVTPTPEREGGDAEVTSLVRSFVPPPPVMTAAIATTNVFGASSALVLGTGDQPVSQVHPSIFADSASIGTTGPDFAGPSNPAGTELSADTFYVSQEMDSGTLRQVYVPKWNVVNESVLDDPDVAEVRLRSKHNFRERKKFERKCVRQVDLLKEKDIEIENLKAQLSLKEADTAEAIHLRNQVSIIEAAKAARAASLVSQRDGFADQVSLLETTYFGLRDQVSGYKLFKEQCDAIQDEHVKALSDRVAGLDSELMDLALHLDEEFYPRSLTTIVGQRWIIGYGLRLAVMKCHQSLKYDAAFRAVIGLAIDKGIQVGLVSGIDHGKARRDLADFAAYDPSVEARYVSAVLAFHDLDFNLLSRLESQKDISIADIISLIFLEGPSVETLETFLSNSLDVVHARVQKLKEDALSHRLSISGAMGVLAAPLSSENVNGKASTLGVPVMAAATTTLAISVTAANISSIPPILVADYDTADAGVQDIAPHSPKIVSENGVSPLLDFIMVRCAHRTYGISSIQSLLPLSNRAIIPSPKLLFSLSTKLLVCGCLTEAKR